MESLIGIGLVVAILVVMTISIYLMGKTDNEREQAEADAEILKKQRDIPRSATRTQYLDRLRKHRRK